MKKIFSFILVVSLVISVLCCPVLAADGDTGDERTFWEKVLGGFERVASILTGGFSDLAISIGEKISTYGDDIKLGIVEFKNNAISSFRTVISWLSSISTTMSQKFDSVINWFSLLDSTIATRFSSAIQWLKDIHSTLSVRLQSSITWLSDIHKTLSVRLSEIGEWASNMHEAIEGGFRDLWGKLSEFSIKDSFNTFIQRFESLFVSGTPDVSLDDDLSQFDDEFADLDSSMDDISDFLNNSFDSFVDYASGFLFVIAFFNALTTIPVFEFLLNLSLSLGLLGLSLNLMSTIVSKAHKRGG